jgi:hypothetical protein
VAPLGLVVVHHHGVDAEEYGLRLLELEAPEEEVEQQPAEQPDPGPPEGPEEAFDRVRGGHVIAPGLDSGGVALVRSELIEADQVATRAVQKETEELVEEADDSKPLCAPAHRAKKAIEVAKESDVIQVAAEESQAAPAGQGIGGNGDGVEMGPLGVARRERGSYGSHSPFGLRAAQTVVGYNFFDTNNLTQRVSLIQPQNRST